MGNVEHTKLYDLIDVARPEKVQAEIRHVAGLIAADFDFALLDRLFADVVRLYGGEFPGYRSSNTQYHDLEHTHAVALALVRLAHGYGVEEKAISGRDLLIGICGALFHDTGLIQEEKDRHGSGAKYTIGHEDRSIAFMKKYFLPRHMPAEAIEDCARLIRCTILRQAVSELDLRSPEIALMGKMVGSADLLAQMADRHYLEKLPLLFKEFEEGGMAGYESELDLLKRTDEFYLEVARPRLIRELGDVARYARAHFRVRWGIDRDLYAESIARNIDYVKSLRQSCLDRAECFRQGARRTRDA